MAKSALPMELSLGPVLCQKANLSAVVYPFSESKGSFYSLRYVACTHVLIFVESAPWDRLFLSLVGPSKGQNAQFCAYKAAKGPSDLATFCGAAGVGTAPGPGSVGSHRGKPTLKQKKKT